MEALERARAAYGTGAYDDATIEFLFPEVKENEDEWIRKWLIEMVEELRKANPTNAEHNGNCSEAIAYLEKQKEQQPAEGTALQKAFISSKINFTLEEKCDASDYAEVILPTSVAYGEDDEEYKLHKIIEAAFIAGQKKEQKPAEWSKEKERAYQKELSYLPKITKEWGEEDEEMRDFAIRAIGLCRQYAINNQVNGYSKLPDVPKRYEELQNWLKSKLIPQPHWKPSEEQMRFLLAVINEPNNAGSESCHIILKSLYHDLKNLK